MSWPCLICGEQMTLASATDHGHHLHQPTYVRATTEANARRELAVECDRALPAGSPHKLGL